MSVFYYRDKHQIATSTFAVFIKKQKSYLISHKRPAWNNFTPTFDEVNYSTPILFIYIIGSLKVATPRRILILSDETTMSSQQSSKVPIDKVITILLLHY